MSTNNIHPFALPFAGRKGYIHRLYRGLGGTAQLIFVQKNASGQTIAEEHVIIPFLPGSSEKNNNVSSKEMSVTGDTLVGYIPSSALNNTPVANRDLILFNGRRYRIMKIEEQLVGNLVLSWRITATV